jgi:hypothetical protein
VASVEPAAAQPLAAVPAASDASPFAAAAQPHAGQPTTMHVAPSVVATTPLLTSGAPATVAVVEELFALQMPELQMPPQMLSSNLLSVELPGLPMFFHHGPNNNASVAPPTTPQPQALGSAVVQSRADPVVSAQPHAAEPVWVRAPDGQRWPPAQRPPQVASSAADADVTCVVEEETEEERNERLRCLLPTEDPQPKYSKVFRMCAPQQRS